MTRRGFTVVELMLVMVIIGILANLALPMVQQARRKAEAVQVIADYRAIMVAAQDHFADVGAYPATQKWGVTPAELVPSLPSGFQFTRGGVEYRWRRWGLPNGLPKNKKQTQLLGLSLRSSDKALVAAVKGLYKGEISNVSAKSITLVID